MRAKDKELCKSIVSYVDEYFDFNKSTPTIYQIADSLGMSKSSAQRYLVYLEQIGQLKYQGRKGILTKKIDKTNSESVNVALVGDISCGLPSFADENVIEYFSLPQNLVGKGKFFLLCAKGDSMVNVGICNGDLVLVRQQDTAENGQIGVALCEDGQATLKRFYKGDNNIILKPENDSMAEIVVDNCQIQGVAVKVLKNLN